MFYLYSVGQMLNYEMYGYLSENQAQYRRHLPTSVFFFFFLIYPSLFFLVSGVGAKKLQVNSSLSAEFGGFWKRASPFSVAGHFQVAASLLSRFGPRPRPRARAHAPTPIPTPPRPHPSTSCVIGGGKGT
ncbi:unnamed protein product [Rangifer tarandus platyrhynchus]|uniref:Uncharacterized protein n=1 Tax=Rangifer tarandus platyrhynchus TaxID=3082113 RepID=A0ABN9A354_RANTA|nr:unnamed protein product [Rangifer tarandus platyrhynchus]